MPISLSSAGVLLVLIECMEWSGANWHLTNHTYMLWNCSTCLVTVRMYMYNYSVQVEHYVHVHAWAVCKICAFMHFVLYHLMSVHTTAEEFQDSWLFCTSTAWAGAQARRSHSGTESRKYMEKRLAIVLTIPPPPHVQGLMNNSMYISLLCVAPHTSCVPTCTCSLLVHSVPHCIAVLCADPQDPAGMWQEPHW